MRLLLWLMTSLFLAGAAHADMLGEMHRAKIDSAKVRGYDAAFSFETGADGLVHGMIIVHTMKQELVITPFHARCRFGKDEFCFRIQTEPSSYSTIVFARTLTGELLGGSSVTTWQLADDPRIPAMGQGVRYERIDAFTERLTFIGWDVRPWAYPAAGFELTLARSGTRTLRVCLAFEKGVCRTKQR